MQPLATSPGTRILVVEDEAIIARDLASRLEALGYPVTGIAVSGEEALTLARETNPSLVFMDITIQGLIDGIETARLLTRAMDVPVVFLTAHTDTGTILRAKKARPYGYLIKPFEERELATTIEMAVFRHRAEAEARLLQQAIAEAGTGIVVAAVAGPEPGITLCNPAFMRMTGYSLDEAFGRPPWFLEGPETDPLASAAIRRAVRDEREGRATLELHRKDGSPLWVDLACSPVRNAVGELTHYLFFHTDASARKQAEASLFRAQKVEAIGQLAGGVAHDFNNILAVVTGYCEMAQREVEADHPAQARLEQVRKAADRAADLTRQLLAFSRKQVLRPRPINLNDIASSTRAMLGRLIGDDIKVVVIPGPDLGTISADPGQVEQILLNLALNARDAMPRGGILSIETRNIELEEEDLAGSQISAASGSHVVLAVSDTGDGMTEEVLARLFEPFFTTKPEGKGTGLGLATVYGIVRQSAGRIAVYSEPGHGTTFRIYFPRLDQLEVEAVPDRTPPSALVTQGTETLLLAEDNASLRAIIEENLGGLGYKVLSAANGEEALRVADVHGGAFDLLLTDMVMPALGGGDLARALRRTEPGLKVIFMSGHPKGAMAEQGVLPEGSWLIEKPFRRDELAVLIRQVLDAGD